MEVIFFQTNNRNNHNDNDFGAFDFLFSELYYFQIYENWQLEKGSAMKFGENQFKVPATEEVMTRLRSNFSIEYEFYEFCKKRLDRQYKSLVMA